MTNTQFFTDGTADLPHEYAQRHDLRVIGLSFLLDGVEYVGDNDPARPGYLTPESFYAKMRQGATPTTSLINQQTFYDAFEPVLREGRDVFFIAFSSGLSGSYFNATRAAEELVAKYPGRRVHVVDTLCASLGEGMMVHLAMQQHEAGMDDDALVQYILDTRLRIHHWFTVDDLVYLKRGGRVSGAAAAIGT
ncbi:MAG: DegV family protein, partial [Clostridiales bacterium]|nr:DegV family protein [Clostridiales bacterium]